MDTLDAGEQQPGRGDRNPRPSHRQRRRRQRVGHRDRRKEPEAETDLVQRSRNGKIHFRFRIFRPRLVHLAQRSDLRLPSSCHEFESWTYEFEMLLSQWSQLIKPI